MIEELITPIIFTKFIADKTTKIITETTVTLHGRRISLTDIRTKLLKDQEQLGVVRLSNPSDDENLSEDEVDNAIIVRKISLDATHTTTTKLEQLQKAKQVRHLKVWHDHGPIAGKGHFMVLVSAIYDPAFYYTPQELAEKGNNVDVISLVEKPEIHMLTHSGSSDVEQMMYNEPRSDSLLDMDSTIITTSNHEVTDIVRFFHGDAPARQFEADNNRGGHYPCTACQTHVHQFNDLSHAFRMETITLVDHQRFMLAGKAWQRGGTRPFQGLDKLKLQTELKAHVQSGSYTREPLAKHLTLMTKKELEAEFTDLKKGYCNFPALIASNPEGSPAKIHIQQYEVAPTEPLHDFKGHMANIIGEIRHKATGKIKEEVEKVYTTTLKKDTTRGVDYRKAAVLLSNVFDRVCPDDELHRLFNTAVQICEIMCSRETNRCQRLLLRLHNLTVQHAVQYVDMFYAPKSISKEKMFGGYFHSLSVHAAILYREVALRSINTELQERMFNSCNNITLTTSNRQANSMLNNILVRVQMESQVVNTTLQKQEGEIRSLASSLKQFTNSKFSSEWIKRHPHIWQAHLERISDFLLCGPGTWWKDNGDSIEFFDGPEEVDFKAQGHPCNTFVHLT